MEGKSTYSSKFHAKSHLLYKYQAYLLGTCGGKPCVHGGLYCQTCKMNPRGWGGGKQFPLSTPGTSFQGGTGCKFHKNLFPKSLCWAVVRTYAWLAGPGAADTAGPGAADTAGQEQEKEQGQEQENGWSLRLMASVVTTSCGEAGTIPIKVF